MRLGDIPTLRVLLLVRELIRTYLGGDAPPADLLLVPGGDKRRELTGAALVCGGAAHHRHLLRPGAPLIVSSGVATIDEVAAAAQIRGRAALVATSASAPAGARCACDRRAVDTVTNFTSLAVELRRRGVRCVAVATSSYHLRRAAWSARIILGSQGIRVRAVAVGDGDGDATGAEARRGRDAGADPPPAAAPPPHCLHPAPESLARAVRDAARAWLWVFVGVDCGWVARAVHQDRWVRPSEVILS
jgi:hypothetical protein